MKTITIGDRPIRKMTEEELLELAIIEGCVPSLKYWEKPIVKRSEVCDVMLGIYYYSVDKKSGRKSDRANFSLYASNKNKLWFSCSNLRTKHNHTKNLSIAAIRYLINQDFDIPIYPQKQS